MTLIPWPRECLSGFSTVKLLLSAFSFRTVLRKEITVHLTGRNLCSPSLIMESLHKSFGILLHGRFVSSLSFICLFVESFISVWTHDMYIILWITIQYDINWFPYSVSLLTIWCPLTWLLCLFDVLLSVLVFLKYFWAFPYFLALQCASVSSCIFLDTVLESTIYLRSSGSFYSKIILETKIWMLNCTSPTEVSFPLYPLSKFIKEIYVYILIHIYLY